MWFRPRKLQQYLPLAVLKLTMILGVFWFQGSFLVATVLTACGIETPPYFCYQFWYIVDVATVLTACGIETMALKPIWFWISRCNSTYRLRYWNRFHCYYLLLKTDPVATVLTACGIETLDVHVNTSFFVLKVATVLTACGIETSKICVRRLSLPLSCNSTYRLRYWNWIST